MWPFMTPWDMGWLSPSQVAAKATLISMVPAAAWIMIPNVDKGGSPWNQHNTRQLMDINTDHGYCRTRDPILPLAAARPDIIIMSSFCIVPYCMNHTVS